MRFKKQNLECGGRMVQALLVDDSPPVMQATSLVPADLGYFVRGVDTAPAAMQAVERRHFALVLSDICLTDGMEGLA